MNVYLTFDIEIWCNGWADLDQKFPASFDRYVYGRSEHGAYALPKTLEILQRHGIPGVFFVEPLFSARFGSGYLQTIVGMLREAKQEIQLHIHPEWTDEISPPLISDCKEKRQHLSYYTQEEQTSLIQTGIRLLQEAGSGTISAFRAGSFAANLDTYAALRDNAIFVDSSLNRTYACSVPDMAADLREQQDAFALENGVDIYPITVFTDGFGTSRHAQVGACGFEELRDSLNSAYAGGYSSFTILSHNFEMLKPGSTTPDFIVSKRFERLCEFLSKNRQRFQTSGFNGLQRLPGSTVQNPAKPPLKSNPVSTLKRHVEQAYRRINPN